MQYSTGVCLCAELLEQLLAEENVMDVVGALEHDPDLAVRQNHRAFLREHVIFKEVCAHLTTTAQQHTFAYVYMGS